MAKNFKNSNTSVNAAVDAITALANSGKVRIYTASQPATADTAVSGQTLLAELTMNSTAFGAASAGVATANAITSDTSADATGTAAWFRVLKSDGTTALWDGSVGTSDADMVINSTAIQSGAAVSISSFTYTLPKSA